MATTGARGRATRAAALLTALARGIASSTRSAGGRAVASAEGARSALRATTTTTTTTTTIDRVAPARPHLSRWTTPPGPTRDAAAAAAAAASSSSSSPALSRSLRTSSSSRRPCDDLTFQAAADAALRRVETVVDRWGEDRATLPDFDLNAESGVVTIALGGGHGTYVLNKQAPNRQIWMSSPVSGPTRYDYDDERRAWIYARDGHALHERLASELTAIGGGEVDLSGLNDDDDE